MTGITDTLGATTIGDLIYTYDANGRRTTMGGSLARVNLPAATTATAVYNSNNQLTSWNGITLTYARWQQRFTSMAAIDSCFAKWILRLLSSAAIAETTYHEYLWGMRLYHQQLYYFLPYAVAPPLAMIYIVFFLTFPERSARKSTSSLYEEVGTDSIRFFIVLTGAFFLILFQSSQ